MTIPVMLLCGVFAVVAPRLNAADAPSTQPMAATEATIQTSVRYLVYLPQGYAKDKTNAAGGGKGWPLVLFLHGAGERGSDLEVVKKHGLPKRIAAGDAFEFIVIAPQCDADERWDAPLLLKLVKKMQQELGADVDRTYVTGLSMGGFGTWDLICRYPHFFAAAVPICGGGEPFWARNLGQLPVWAFHGDADPIVPVERTREMVAAAKDGGDTNVKLTLYPGVGHVSWEAAYNDPELYTWMLAQHRTPKAAPAGGETPAAVQKENNLQEPKKAEKYYKTQKQEKADK